MMMNIVKQKFITGFSMFSRILESNERVMADNRHKFWGLCRKNLRTCLKFLRYSCQTVLEL